MQATRELGHSPNTGALSSSCIVWSLDIGGGDVSDGWWPGALTLPVPLGAWPPAGGRAAFLLYTPNKRHLCNKQTVNREFQFLFSLLPSLFPPPLLLLLFLSMVTEQVAVKGPQESSRGTHRSPLCCDSGQHVLDMGTWRARNSNPLFLSSLPSYLYSLCPHPLLPSIADIYSVDPRVSWPI